MALVLSANSAFAHHIMGGRTPATFSEGMLSGLGHPVIGLDHFAAVVAVGCIAAMHSAGAALVVAFIVSMMAGVALHLNGATVPAAEILVALSVIALGALMLSRRQTSTVAALVLFALVGLAHGTLWESRSSVPRNLRFMPICSALRSSRLRSRSSPWRLRAISSGHRKISRRCGLSGPASPVSDLQS
jgi:hypothetical protein